MKVGNMKEKEYYEGLEHAAKNIQKFVAAAGMFTLSMKDGKIIHHTPKDPVAFRTWLLAHNVKDIRKSL